MKRRKDSKKRVLKEGESQRKDGLYQYRWTDRAGKRHTVYAGDLKELREKEKKIQDSILSGSDFDTLKLTVYEFVKRYNDTRVHALSIRTAERNASYIKRLQNDPIGNKLVANTTVFDAKSWVKELYENGLGYDSLNDYRAILSCAFQAAYEDGLVVRNPFAFKLSKVIPRNIKEKEIITDQQYRNLLEFMRGNGFYRKRIDDIVILYETGIRASEFCGLTEKDVDLDSGILKIDHQIYRTKGGSRTILKPKSRAGNRIVPLSPMAKDAFRNVIDKKNKSNVDIIIDGRSGFLFPGQYGTVRQARDLESFIKSLTKSYNKVHPEDPLPHITPHTFRHTFCSRLIQSGMNIKAVQYFMGHSTSKITLEVYAHVFKDASIEEFVKNFAEKSTSSTTPITTPISQNLHEVI
jgi:integrase